MATEEPVIIRRDKQRLIVEDRDSGTVYAYCYVGHDLDVESIADSLSLKRMPKAAMKFRKMARDAWKTRVPV